MKIANEINTFCRYCRQHTAHKVKNASRGQQRGLSKATRRHERAIAGYVGSVEPVVGKQFLGRARLSELVVHAEALDRHRMRSRKEFGDGASETARGLMLFNGDDAARELCRL